MKSGQLIFLLLPVLLVFLLFSSQRKRQRQAQQTQSAIEPGARICTTAGLFATVVEIDDQTVLLEAAPGVRLLFDRRAVAQVVPGPDPDSEDAAPGQPADPDEGPAALQPPPVDTD